MAKGDPDTSIHAEVVPVEGGLFGVRVVGNATVPAEKVYGEYKTRDLAQRIADRLTSWIEWEMGRVSPKLNDAAICWFQRKAERSCMNKKDRATSPNTESDELHAEARTLRAEIDRLVAALAAGTASPTIATAIDQRERRLSEVRARLDVIKTAPNVLDLEARRLEREARRRLGSFGSCSGETRPRRARRSKRC